LRRHLQQAADSSVDPSERQTEEELRSWIASSSFNWSMRNHLIDHLQKTLPLASSPEQRSALEQLLKQCQGWSEAELRRTKASLRPLTESDLWRLRVWELKALASELWSRGINGPHPRRMRKLAIYTGAGVRKAQAVEGLWAALNHTSSPV
jgi:hypothetical protein